MADFIGPLSKGLNMTPHNKHDVEEKKCEQQTSTANQGIESTEKMSPDICTSMPPVLEKEINDFRSEAEKELVKLAEIYGPAGAKLSRVDAVTLMDGWNKVLAFQTMWKEAFFMRWRILLARKKVRACFVSYLQCHI
jgi:hypothetical protein